MGVIIANIYTPTFNYLEFATCRKLREWLKTWSTDGKRPRSMVSCVAMATREAWSLVCIGPIWKSNTNNYSQFYCVSLINWLGVVYSRLYASGIAMIFSKKGVATIILSIFVANAFLLILIYLLSKV